MPFSEQTQKQIQKTLDLGEQLKEAAKTSDEQVVVFCNKASVQSILNVVNTGMRAAILLQGTTDSMVEYSNELRDKLPKFCQEKTWLYCYGSIKFEEAENMLRKSINEELENKYTDPPWRRG